MRWIPGAASILPWLEKHLSVTAAAEQLEDAAAVSVQHRQASQLLLQRQLLLSLLGDLGPREFLEADAAVTIYVFAHHMWWHRLLDASKMSSKPVCEQKRLESLLRQCEGLSRALVGAGLLNLVEVATAVCIDE